MTAKKRSVALNIYSDLQKYLSPNLGQQIHKYSFSQLKLLKNALTLRFDAGFGLIVMIKFLESASLKSLKIKSIKLPAFAPSIMLHAGVVSRPVKNGDFTHTHLTQANFDTLFEVLKAEGLGGDSVRTFL